MAKQKITPTQLTNPYKFLTYRSTTYTTPNGVWGKVTMDTESYDTNNNFTGGTYTAPVTGYYYLYARIEVGGSSQTLVSGIYKTNGGNTGLLYGNYATATAQASTVGGLVFLTAGDTIEPWCYCSAAVTGNGGSASVYFGGFLYSV